MPSEITNDSTTANSSPSSTSSGAPFLLEPTDIHLDLEILPPETAGELKTYNETPTEIARKQITYRGLGILDDVKTNVQLVACAHGWSRSETQATRLGVQRERRSLFVFDYMVNKTGVTEEGEKHEAGSVKTEWRFGEVRVKKLQREDLGPSGPTVVAIAPFKEKRGHYTKGDVSITKSKGGTVGVDQYVNIEGQVGRERALSHRQEYFDRGYGLIEYNDAVRREDRGAWYLAQNPSQNLGVESGFSVALLVKRQSDANFEGEFEIRVGEGKWVSMKQWARKTFGRPKDDQVNFDPGRAPEGERWSQVVKYAELGEWESLRDSEEQSKEQVLLDNLDALRGGDTSKELVGLVKVPGLGWFQQFEVPKEVDDEDSEDSDNEYME